VFKASDVSLVVPDFSRQYVSTVIGKMVSKGSLIREGSGRWSQYAFPENQDYLGHRIRRRLPLVGLKEHEVLNDIMNVSTILKRVPENVQSIFNYAFSEMLNNAIDHSESDFGDIEVVEEDERLKFIVNDILIMFLRGTRSIPKSPHLIKRRFRSVFIRWGPFTFRDLKLDGSCRV
jgi:hypothetical protein